MNLQKATVFGCALGKARDNDGENCVPSYQFSADEVFGDCEWSGSVPYVAAVADCLRESEDVRVRSRQSEILFA